MNVFIARQPVFDRNLKVVAYELLYRAGQVNSAAGMLDPNKASKEVLVTAFSEIGLEKITNGLPALVNITQEILVTGALPKGLQKHLIPEVLEDVLVNADVIQEVKNLIMLGYKIALDDFGVEYSCLKYLKHLPVDVLKIDKYFVNECAIHEADRILLKTIVQMGHSLDISVVAEGVENEQQLEVLRQEKCDAYQGYLYSQPLTPSEFISLVEHHNQSMKE